MFRSAYCFIINSLIVCTCEGIWNISQHVSKLGAIISWHLSPSNHNRFLPARSYASAGILAVVVCLYVRLSVCLSTPVLYQNG